MKQTCTALVKAKGIASYLDAQQDRLSKKTLACIKKKKNM